VKLQHRDVLLASLQEDLCGPGRVAGQRRETAGDLGVERPRVRDPVDRGPVRIQRRQRLVDRVAHPRGELVGGGTGGLVDVDDAEPEQFRDGALVRRDLRVDGVTVGIRVGVPPGVRPRVRIGIV